MGKRFFGTIAALAVAASAFAFSPDELHVLTIENETGYEILYLFFSPADSNFWGVDVLGSNRTFPSGDSIGFLVHYPEYCGAFDLLAIDEDLDAYYMFDIELCDDADETVTITFDSFDGDFGEPTFATVSLTNDLYNEIYYLFLSPADSEKWGVDVLDIETILGPDDVAEFLVLRSSGVDEYDVLAIDDDYDLYRFRIELDDTSHYTYLIEYGDMVF